MVHVITVSSLHDETDLQSKSNTFFDNFNILISEDTDVYTDDGKLLLKFRKNKISDDMCKILYSDLKSAAAMTRGRAESSGMQGEKYSYIKSKSTGKIIHQLNSKAPSGIVGYYDNKSFFGHRRQVDGAMCRQTAYTRKHMDRFSRCAPIFSYIDSIYEELVPEFYDIQRNAINKLDPNYRIENTVFTTVTVNKNFRTALHKDSGDFRDGFGVIVVAGDGDYDGCYTMFPKYGVAVDCKNGDFLAMDVHEWHCNSEKSGSGNRLSLVLYLREKMLQYCGKE